MQFIQRQLIFVVSLLVATIGVIVVIVIPMARELYNTATIDKQTSAEQEKQYFLRTHSRTTLSRYEDALTKISRLNELIPLKKGDELSFITAIEQAANASKVSHELHIESVNSKAISAWQSDTPFTITIRGTYDHVRTFVGLIEQLPYAISMSTIELREDNRAALAANPTLIGTLKGTIYAESDIPPFLKQRPVTQ